jgi:hypothetical protein
MRVLALLLLVVPLALVACGGGKSSSSEVKLSPTAYVKQAAHKSASASSVHMKLKGSVGVSGQSVILNGAGDFDFQHHDGSFQLDFNAGGLGGSVDAVIQGADLYVRSPLFSDALPKGKSWLRLDLAKQAKAQGLDLTRLAAQNPAQTLARLASLGDVKDLGAEQVDGVDTTHYRGHFAKVTATQSAGPFDVWVGKDDGYVRRVQFATAAAGSATRSLITMNLSDFGKDVTVTVPSAAETADATTLNIPGLGG